MLTDISVYATSIPRRILLPLTFCAQASTFPFLPSYSPPPDVLECMSHTFIHISVDGCKKPLCHCDFYLHSGWAIRCLPMKTDLEQNWIQWNALGPTDSDWCRMSPRLSPWKMRLAKDLPCEQYNVSPCIGDSVQGTAEIWTSPQLEVYISIAILQNMCFGACWEKGFIFSSVQTKVTQLYYVAGIFFFFPFFPGTA